MARAQNLKGVRDLQVPNRSTHAPCLGRIAPRAYEIVTPSWRPLADRDGGPSVSRWTGRLGRQLGALDRKIEALAADVERLFRGLAVVDEARDALHDDARPRLRVARS